MAKHDNVAKGTKKYHILSKQEKKQQRIILTSALVAAVLIVGLISFGLLNEYVFKYNRPVATINGEELLPAEFQKQVRFNRSQLLQQYQQYNQLAAFFGSDPQMGTQITDTLNQIQTQLLPENASVIGNNVLDQLTNQILISQEAKKLGITISDQEVEEAFQAAFGFFPGGTPTPQPTATLFVPPTLSPEQVALITLTPTPEPTEALPTATPESTQEATPQAPDPTAEPLPTATVYTETMFSTQISDYLTLLEKLNVGFTETDLRQLIYHQLLYEKVNETITADVARIQEQVWARHILVKDQATALLILDSLEQGADWTQLAADLSLDTSNKDQGGDLGWFARGQMVPAFEEAAFNLPIGGISEPVETDFGWHVIQVLGHEERPLNANVYQNKLTAKFSEWLATVKENSTISISDTWADLVPQEPALNQETFQILQEQQPQ